MNSGLFLTGIPDVFCFFRMDSTRLVNWRLAAYSVGRAGGGGGKRSLENLEPVDKDTLTVTGLSVFRSPTSRPLFAGEMETQRWCQPLNPKNLGVASISILSRDPSF